MVERHHEVLRSKSVAKHKGGRQQLKVATGHFDAAKLRAGELMDESLAVETVKLSEPKLEPFVQGVKIGNFFMPARSKDSPSSGHNETQSSIFSSHLFGNKSQEPSPEQAGSP